MKLSIVVPAYNEEKRIRAFFDAYLPYFKARYGREVEFVVVVNGSRDATERIAKEYAALFEQIRVIVEPAKIGKGGALMLGFRAALGGLVGFVDADGATPPEAFEDLTASMGAADVIIASRWLPGARITLAQPFMRRLSSRFFNLLVRGMFGLRITDTQCGAKLMRQPALAAVLPHLGITRWAFDVDFLFQFKRLGYVIIERPTTWHDVEGSQLQVGRASLEMFVAMCRLRLLYSPFRFIVRAYDHTIGRFVHVSSH